jgi:hypothetical protein
MSSPPRRTTRRSSFGAADFEDKENAQPAKNERRRSVLKVRRHLPCCLSHLLNFAVGARYQGVANQIRRLSRHRSD